LSTRVSLREGRVLYQSPAGSIVAVPVAGRTLVFARRRVGVSERMPARISLVAFEHALREAFRRVMDRLVAGEGPRVKVSSTRIGIVSWSLPSYVTCPGASTWCEEYCYAMKGLYVNPRVEEARVENLVASLYPGFVEELVRVLYEAAVRAAERTGLPEPIVRLFDSGDVYDPAVLRERLREMGVDVERLEGLLGVRLDELPRDYFARLLYEAVRALNELGVRVYMYTRSWRLPHLREWLERMAELPRTVVWLSVDPAMSREEVAEAEAIAARHERMGVAYTGMLPLNERLRYHLCLKPLGVVNCAQCLVCPYAKAKRVVLPTH